MVLCEGALAISPQTPLAWKLIYSLADEFNLFNVALLVNECVEVLLGVSFGRGGLMDVCLKRDVLWKHSELHFPCGRKAKREGLKIHNFPSIYGAVFLSQLQKKKKTFFPGLKQRTLLNILSNMIFSGTGPIFPR